jgi:hypothetical protein
MIGSSTHAAIIFSLAKGIDKCLHRNLPVAPSSLMGSVLIIYFQPRVQIGLEFIERSVDLFTKCDSIKPIQHGFVKPFTDTVGLGLLVFP